MISDAHWKIKDLFLEAQIHWYALHRRMTRSCEGNISACLHCAKSQQIAYLLTHVLHISVLCISPHFLMGLVKDYGIRWVWVHPHSRSPVSQTRSLRDCTPPLILSDFHKQVQGSNNLSVYLSATQADCF